MATDSRLYRDEGYTISRAVGDVFGRWPVWPWSVLALIGVGGMAGVCASFWLAPSEVAPRPELRRAACMGYGILVAALVSLLPRTGKIIALRSALGHRPSTDTPNQPWWPLRLLAAALRQTPTLRLTQQDFAGAVGQAVIASRSLLTAGLWPACLAGFVAPVLGLLSAWESGAQIDFKPGEEAASVYMRVLTQISPPMVATISVALVLMIVLAVIDQFTKGLLQKWADAVTLTDAGSEFVKGLIGEGRTSDGPGTIPDGGATSPPMSAGEHTSRTPAKRPDTRITAEGLERLGESFSSGR